MADDMLGGSPQGVITENGIAQSGNAGEAAPDSELSPDILAEIERWKGTEAGKAFIRSESRRRIDHIVADVRQAIGGDTKAKANLGPDGRRVLRVFEERLTAERTAFQATLAETENRAFASVNQYNSLAYLYQNDPTAFQQELLDPVKATFWASWQQWRAENGMAENRPMTDRQAQRAVAAQVQQGTDTLMEQAYDSLRGNTEASSLLTETDWDALHPDNFTDMDPQEARRKFDALALDRLAEAKARKLAAPVAAAAARAGGQAAAARSAAASSIPSLAGAGSAAALSDADIETILIQKAQRGERITPQDMDMMRESRARRGLSTAQDRRW